MKKAYAESTLKRKYREIGLRKETVRKLKLYMTACANFYKLAEADEVWKAIEKTEKMLAGKEFKEAVTPELIYAANEILMDEEGTVTDLNNEASERKLVDIVTTMIEPLDPMPTRAQFDAFIQVEEHNRDLCIVLEESELYLDGENGKFMIADIRMMWNMSEDIPEGRDDTEVTVLDPARLCALDYERKGKKLYIPEDLLCYAAEGYMPQTAQSNALLAWLEKKGVSNADADEILYELYRLVREGSIMGSTQQAVDCLTERNVVFDGMDEVQTYMRLYTEFSNHTCRPANKGQTPAKMSAGRSRVPQDIVFGPGFREMIRKGDINVEEMKAGFPGANDFPEQLKTRLINTTDCTLAPGEERWVGGTLIKGAKIGPNDPCPCGSGRKYKKCCGKK